MYRKEANNWCSVRFDLTNIIAILDYVLIISIKSMVEIFCAFNVPCSIPLTKNF